MSGDRIRYAPAGGTGPSPRLWTPEFYNPTMWFGHFDDFALANIETDKLYDTYADTGVTMLAQVANDAVGGILEIAGNDADNDEGVISTAPMFQIDTDGSLGKVRFGFRIKKASIADNALAFFVGLAEGGFAAADALIDTTGEVKDADLIGFRVKHDAGEELDFVHRLNGQAVQETIANIQAMVADTWINLEFEWNPDDPTPAERGKIYVDNTKQSTFFTQADLDATTGPEGQQLALVIATKTGAAAESKFQVDWMYGFQERA